MFEKNAGDTTVIQIIIITKIRRGIKHSSFSILINVINARTLDSSTALSV